ncbi:hypothetical protein N9E48_02205 [Paracoccaceae bacterium]|nr:hypothetical protein [Paracoccaceae bacterium]
MKLDSFNALAEHGPIPSKELAQNTGSNERYLREWMYGVALAGYITFDKTSSKGSLSEEKRLFWLKKEDDSLRWEHSK